MESSGQDENTKQKRGKSSHVDAFDSYDENNHQCNKSRPYKIDLVQKVTASDEEWDNQRALYTSTREKNEKGN